MFAKLVTWKDGELAGTQWERPELEDIRTAVHAWFEEEQLGEYLSVGQQKDLALMLLEEDHTEDKL